MKNTVIVALLGLVAVIGVYVVVFLLDDTIRTEEDVEKYLGLSTVGVIPLSNELNVMSKYTGKKKMIKKGLIK